MKAQLEKAAQHITALEQEKETLIAQNHALHLALDSGRLATPSDSGTATSQDAVSALQAQYDTLAAKNRALEFILADTRKKLETAGQTQSSNPEKSESASQGHASELEEQLQKMEEQLIHTAKLATLGQLVAGISHEINTPIGAINAAASNLSKSVPALLQNLPAILAEVPIETREIFYKMVDRGMAYKEAISSRDERQFKKQLTELLDNKGIPGASNLAPGLVKMGIFDEVDDYLPLFKHPRVTDLVELASTAGKLKLNIDNINIAIGKAMKINQGLKNFSHKSDPDKPEMADLRENIETVLTVYHNVLKYNVETSFYFDPALPKILCFPDELSQVWANLINNAAQAMNAAGKLSIRAIQENGHIQVEITDSGPGIPAEIKDKIFDPFFTTKKKGEGTGLGLDIVRKIVSKHHGQIKLASEPGNTTFTIILPIRQDA